MLLFKTSAATLDSVIVNKKHALKHEPKSWEKDEIILVSKNKRDCAKDEKQISHIMFLESIVKLKDKEIKKFWPSSKNNWNYLVNCNKVVKLNHPFNLRDAIENNAKIYGPSLKPKKIMQIDEPKIINYLKKINAI